MRKILLVLLMMVFMALPLAATEEEHGGAAAHGETHVEKTYFGIPATVWKIANLVIFLGVLFYLLGGPIKKAFAERRVAIQAELAEAKTRREKSDRLAADIEARLQQMEREVASLLTRAQEEGERQKQELIAAADLEATKILNTARNEVDARVKMARAELMKLAGDIATQRAATLVAGAITDTDRHKLFADSVRQIEEMGS